MTGIVVSIAIFIYLVLHGYHYDWWKSRLGLTHNSSLISVAVMAIGVTVGGSSGVVLSAVGATWFLVALAYRACLMLSLHRSRKDLT